MPLVTSSVPNLINGVSQQADPLRYPSQVDEQINAVSSISEGITKRPHSTHILRLRNSSYTGDLFTAPIIRDASEEYLLTVTGGLTPSLQINDLEGTQIPIQDSDGFPITVTDLAYLATLSPRTSLKAVTVADYTLLLNTDKVAALKTDVSALRPPEALLMVKQIRRGADYTVSLYNTPTDANPTYTYSLNNIETNIDSTVVSPDPKVADQQTVAQILVGGLVAAGADTEFDFASDGGVIYLKKEDNSDFRVEIKCTLPEGLFVFKDSVQNFSLLPKQGWSGFTILVKGDPETTGDDYYIKYVPTAPTAISGFVAGTWEEAQKGGLQDELDPTTLPHALLSYGTHFVYKPLDWAKRSCGDTKSNPNPSFVGQKINDIFFYQNRLGLLAGENCLLSENSEFFNYWRTTVLQLLDSDPIDVGVASTRVSILTHAVPAAEKLFLFSGQTQFTLQGDGILTPHSVTVKESSSYDNNSLARPLSIGNRVYFSFDRGGYSGLYEYAIQPETGLFAATDSSGHVPKYIRGKVLSVEGSDAVSTLFVRSSGFLNGLYLYRFFYQQNQPVQAAWSKWDFGGELANAFLIRTKLYLLVARPGGIFLESVDLDVGKTDLNSSFSVRLDRRTASQDITLSYDAYNNRTTYTLPYAPVASRVAAVVQATDTNNGGFTTGFSSGFRLSGIIGGAFGAGFNFGWDRGGTKEGGQIVPIINIANNTVTVQGDWRLSPLWFGETYSTKVVLSTPRLREARGGGNFVVMPGRFQVRYGYLSYSDSLHFKVIVQLPGRPDSIKEFSPRKIGVFGNLVGTSPTPQEGVLRFPVFSKNDQTTITLLNDSPLPSSFLSVDWEALYQDRSARV